LPPCVLSSLPCCRSMMELNSRRLPGGTGECCSASEPARTDTISMMHAMLFVTTREYRYIRNCTQCVLSNSRGLPMTPHPCQLTCARGIRRVLQREQQSEW
jgi:hypothetical protein